MNARTLLATLLFAAALTSAEASLYVIVDATSVGSNLGYAPGQSYTFQYELGDYGEASPLGFTSDRQHFWMEETTAHPVLFASFGGDGLTGEYTRPTRSDISPSSELLVEAGSGRLKLLLTSDHDRAMGLRLGYDYLRGAWFDVTLDGVDFDTSGPLENPSEYFLDYQGVYTVSATGVGRIYGAAYRTDNEFEVTQVTIVSILAQPVPEPSVWAALIGLASLGITFWRRHRR